MHVCVSHPPKHVCVGVPLCVCLSVRVHLCLWASPCVYVCVCPFSSAQFPASRRANQALIGTLTAGGEIRPLPLSAFSINCYAGWREGWGGEAPQQGPCWPLTLSEPSILSTQHQMRGHRRWLDADSQQDKRKYQQSAGRYTTWIIHTNAGCWRA